MRVSMVSRPPKRRFASMPVSASGDMRGALLERDADLVVPVDVVGRGGDEAERERGVGVERLADRGARRVERRAPRRRSGAPGATGR